MKLMREIRCFLSAEADTVVRNTWSGTGGSDVGTFWALRAVLDGPVDPRTGYLCDIKEIDDLLRGPALDPLREAWRTCGGGLDALLVGLPRALATAAVKSPASTRLDALHLLISPYTSLSVRKENAEVIELTQSFEFSAAHRLHCGDLSAEQNARLFGKCSNPNGHGHNYILEVTVAGVPDRGAARAVDLPRIDALVRQRVIEPFDHKNLNLECPDFSALNPTVENIARVIWTRLETAVAPARLTRVRVWETAKTYAECTSGE